MDENQKRMEEHVERTLYENNVLQESTFNGMMESYSGGCSYEERSLTFCFPVLEWESNRAGFMHGGAISGAFDMTIAALARFYAGKGFAPTVSLDIKYVRPVEIGDTLVVTAKAVSVGKRISQFTAEAVGKNKGKTVATAASVYLNVDTSTENGKAPPSGSISRKLNYSDRF